LQRELDKKDPEDRYKIFDGVIDSISTISNDGFGNFVVQKLLEHGNPEQQKEIVEKLKGEVEGLATNKFGCRVMQRALQVLPSEEKVELVAGLKAKVADCIENQNANHVIQKIVEHMPDDCDFIIEALTRDSGDQISGHEYGCRVVQRCLEFCDHDRLDDLLRSVFNSIAKLAPDRHGNYVIQSVLSNAKREHVVRVINSVRENFVEFSKNKIASNVVEKALEAASSGKHADTLHQEYSNLYRAALGERGATKTPIHDLMHDKFGNFAVQKLMKFSRGDEKEDLHEFLKRAESDLNSSAPGRHIIAAMKKEWGDTSQI